MSVFLSLSDVLAKSLSRSGKLKIFPNSSCGPYSSFPRPSLEHHTQSKPFEMAEQPQPEEFSADLKRETEEIHSVEMVDKEGHVDGIVMESTIEEVEEAKEVTPAMEELILYPDATCPSFEVRYVFTFFVMQWVA